MEFRTQGVCRRLDTTYTIPPSLRLRPCNLNPLGKFLMETVAPHPGMSTLTLSPSAACPYPNKPSSLREKMSAQFSSGEGSDGLLGLAWPSINTVSPQPVKTPVENMIGQKLISQPLFTVKLDRGDNAGFYSFGAIDETVTSNPITYTAVDNSQGFWMVPSTSYTLNGETIARQDNTAILDTGTTLALIDDDAVSKIYAAIKGAKFDSNQGGWMYPATSKVPSLAFAIGDTMYTLNAADFPYGEAEDGYLFGGVQSRGSNPFDILGDIFLKSVYVVFNQGESTVGLAQRDD
ncbi:Acid protease [Mycena sanguinolenta]|uniref:Acid protease n=1 Tax=Mycena sanguinolenta TaxID=230812 RepID=A0A8H6ZG36_9AGAR|nr:Acid protease [Mycena sanguinolenta]